MSAFGACTVDRSHVGAVRIIWVHMVYGKRAMYTIGVVELGLFRNGERAVVKIGFIPKNIMERVFQLGLLLKRTRSGGIGFIPKES